MRKTVGLQNRRSVAMWKRATFLIGMIVFAIVVYSTEAYAMKAYLVGQRSSNIPMKHVCIYSYMGEEVGLLFPIGKMCPLSVDM